MSFKHFIAATFGMAALTLSASSGGEVYSGEPLGEALSDLTGAATLISHELSSASPLLRTDVFRLTDGRLVAITSRASKVDQPFSIEELRVTSSAASKLTKRVPTVSVVKFRK